MKEDLYRLLLITLFLCCHPAAAWSNGGYSDDADMDGDGRVTSVDALMILQAAGGCIEID